MKIRGVFVRIWIQRNRNRPESGITLQLRNDYFLRMVCVKIRELRSVVASLIEGKRPGEGAIARIGAIEIADNQCLIDLISDAILVDDASADCLCIAERLEDLKSIVAVEGAVIVRVRLGLNIDDVDSESFASFPDRVIAEVCSLVSVIALVTCQLVVVAIRLNDDTRRTRVARTAAGNVPMSDIVRSVEQLPVGAPDERRSVFSIVEPRVRRLLLKVHVE
jgi:hypothetical protein